MPSPDVTVFELDRRLTRFEQEHVRTHRDIDNRVARVAGEAVPMALYDERHARLRDRVLDLERELEGKRIFYRNVTISVISALVASLCSVVAATIAVALH